jgi:molybdate transport system substrate-binding protein
VFAASSLTELVEALGRSFTSEHPACRVTFNLGASNALALQIEAGARADVFLSAARIPVDQLVASGKITTGPPRVLFSNRLVLVSSANYPSRIDTVCALSSAKVERIAIGQPDAVPAGAYAKAYLSRTRCRDGQTLWESLEQRLLPMPNVRAVLSVVEQQPGLVGFVYQTDAWHSKTIQTQFVVDGPDAPRIEYYGVRLGDSPMADAFLAEFAKPAARDTMRNLGFLIE